MKKLNTFLFILSTSIFYAQNRDSIQFNTFGINFNINFKLNFADQTSRYQTLEAYMYGTEFEGEKFSEMNVDNNWFFQNLTGRFAFDVFYGKKINAFLPKLNPIWNFGFNYLSANFYNDFNDPNINRFGTFTDPSTNQAGYYDTVLVDYYYFTNKSRSYSILNEVRLGTNPYKAASFNFGLRNTIGVTLNKLDLSTYREGYIFEVVDDQLGLINDDYLSDYDEFSPVEEIYTDPYKVTNFYSIDLQDNSFEKEESYRIKSNFILGFAIPLQFNVRIFRTKKSDNALYFNLNYLYNLNLVFVPERKNIGLSTLTTYNYGFAGLGLKYKL